MLNREKTAVIPPGARKIVLGLFVYETTPRLSRAFKDKIRQHFYYIEKFGVEEHVIRGGFDSVGGFCRHLKGLLDFSNMVEPGFARDCYAQFAKILEQAHVF